MLVSLVIPCYNEEKNLPLLFRKLKKIIDLKSFEIIIVENGSSDNSLAIIKEFYSRNPNFKYVVIDKNIGYGYGILRGLKIANGDLLAWTHSDLQTNPLDILEGIKLFKNSKEKIFVKGLRYGRNFEDNFFTFGMSFIASISLFNILWDINAQPSIFPASFYNSWQNPPKDFSLDLYAYYQAKKNGYEVKRFPVNFSKRLHGISKWNFNFKSKIKFVFRTLKYILKLSIGNKKWK